MNPIRAVALDAFGTLVEIGDQRRPFGRLMKWIRDNHRAPAEDDAAWLMSREVDLVGAAVAAGVAIPAAVLAGLQRELEIELASICAFEDAARTLSALRGRGLKLAVCSNLVSPYAAPTLCALPPLFDATIWSFAVGAIKPQPAIYRAVSSALGSLPAEILFVGDTRDADVDGPRAFGMQALHLVREGARPGDIRSLDEILPWLADRRCG